MPILCLVGAAISAYRRRQRQNLVVGVIHSLCADPLAGMSWQEFEQLVGEAFGLQGFHVKETGGGGADGGIDLVLTRGSEKILVQCKQWRSFNVGVAVIRELNGVMAATGAAGGFVVTAGRFTDEAKAFASGRNVKLVDGPRLHGLIKQALAARSSAVTRPPWPWAQPAGETASVPPCPVCSKPMEQRTGTRGKTAGQGFCGSAGDPSVTVRPKSS